LGGGAAPAPPLAPWGASSIRVAKKNARNTGRPPLRWRDWPGWLSYAACSRSRGGRRRKAVALLQFKPCQLSNVQEETHSCAREQVVIARPPVPTPPRRYRRSLVSKQGALYGTQQCDLRVGTRSSLTKWRYRVVIDYVGGPLSHRGRKGCRLFRGSRHVCEFGKTASCLWVFVVVVVASD
jgi:hypothetical protein